MTMNESLKNALLVGASVAMTMFVLHFWTLHDHDVEDWLGSTDPGGISVYTRLTEILDKANDDFALAEPPISRRQHDAVHYEVSHWGLKMLDASKTDADLRTILKSAWENAQLGTAAGWAACIADLEAGH